MTCLVCDVCLCCKKKTSVTCKDANHVFFTHYPRSLSVSSHRMCNHAGFTHTSKEANKHIYIYIFIYMFFYFVYLRNSVFMDDLVKVFCRSIVYDMGHCMCRFFKADTLPTLCVTCFGSKLTPYARPQRFSRSGAEAISSSNTLSESSNNTSNKYGS